jgi:uncharacterized spore protein YtfJ
MPGAPKGENVDGLQEGPRPPRPGGRMIERLADRLGANAMVDVVVGEPIEHDGVKVIPLAKARYGFGGGEGSAEQEGGGGGGGVSVVPIGYVELRDGRARFHRVIDAEGAAMLMASAALLLLVASRAIVRLLRR